MTIKRSWFLAPVALFVFLVACDSPEPARPEESGSSKTGRIVRDYIDAVVDEDAEAAEAMWSDRVRSLPEFERYFSGTAEGIRSVGRPLVLEELDPIRNGSGLTHLFHAEFAEMTGRVYVNVDLDGDRLDGLYFEPFPDGQTEDPRDSFESHVFESGSHVLPYRLLTPSDIEPDRRYPLVLFLHGAGQRGDENFQQIHSGIWGFSDSDVREQYPAFVVAPQCPLDQQWVDTPWGDDAHDMPATPTWPLQLAMDLLDDLQTEFPIDTDRVYLTGLSMGGFGAWDAVQRYPQRFAAAAPICGGGDPAYAADIVDVPIWAFHGDQDVVVKVQRSRDMIDAIRSAGGDPRYTEYPGVNHNSWEPAYRDREFYDWLFAQRLSGR